MSGSGDIGLLIGVLGLLFAWLGLVAMVLRPVIEELRLAREANTSDKGPGHQCGDRVGSRRIPAGGSQVGLPRTVRIGLAISVIAVLVALVGFGVHWVLQHRKISHLEDNNTQLKSQAADHKAVNEAVTARLASMALLPGSERWEAEHQEYAIWLWVTDDQDRAIPGCKASVTRTGERAVTYEGGLTGTLWMGLGDKVLLEKDGYQPQEAFLDIKKAEKRIIQVELRRKDHVNKEIAAE